MLQALLPWAPARAHLAKTHSSTRFGNQPAGKAPLHPVGDVVRFRGQGTLAEKYGIDPAQVDLIKNPALVLPVSKAELLERLLEAHEHARKNKLLGNYSGRQYSTNLLMGNGQWALGTNIELTRDTVLCGERSSLVNSWNAALARIPVETLQDESQKADVEKGLKGVLLAMSSGDDVSHPSAGSPCSECQSWLATDRYFGPDTIVTNLGKNEQGRYFIRARQMKELLPLLAQQVPSRTDKAIASLPVHVSDKARAAMQAHGLGEAALVKLVKQAKEAYRTNETAVHSGKNTGSAVLLSNGKTVKGQRLDWTARWFESPELAAATRGVQRLHGDRVQAVAYYGDAVMPEVKTLGILAQETWGGPDTLMAVIEQDAIQVRTIQDYMTDIYISKSTHTGRK